jgi:muconate cycloisomerase
VAKSAVEMAMLDAACRIIDLPLCDMLGGAMCEGLPVLWALGTGDRDADVAEAQAVVAAGRHAMFKIKMGFAEPQDDLFRVIETAEAIGLPCSIDLNEAWDLALASRLLPMLEGSGVVMIEQPLARTDLAGMAALAARLDVPVMADEAVCTPQQALAVAVHRAAEVISLKISKAGGIRKTQQIAAVAHSAGLSCFGGTALDSSIGVAASLHLFTTLPGLSWGCELFAPLLLTDEIVTRPVSYRDNQVWRPSGPGIGVEIDEDKLRHYRREGTGI